MRNVTRKTSTLKPYINPTSTLKLRCYFCGGNLKAGNAHVEIHDQELPPHRSQTHTRFNEHGGKEERGSLAYPGNGERLCDQGKWNDFERVVLFTHTECGPDGGYHFSFDRLDEDWESHLRSKAWWIPEIDEALTIARKGLEEMNNE
jgi:hypothetical protein